MDPLDLLTVANVLTRFARLGLAAWKVAGGPPLDEREAAAVARFLSDGDRRAGRRSDGRPGLALLHFQLVTLAFVEAWRRHWAHDAQLAPALAASRWEAWLGATAARRKQVESAMSAAALRLVRLGDLPGAIEREQWGGIGPNPLASDWYRGLWAAFTEVDGARVPLLLLEGEGRRQFERHFLLAWWEGLGTPSGAPLRQWLLDAQQDRARIVRELSLAEVAGWRERHVFGPGGAAVLPPMPLEAIYVEPLAVIDDGTREPPTTEDDDDGTVWTDDDDGPPSGGARPVIELLHELLERHRVVVVTAPFGQGKSLTARMLASRWAEAWSWEPVPSPELVLPVFVRCADDLAGRPDVEAAIRRALQREARAVGIDLKLGDPALTPPEPEQRAVFLLDGLDEVALSPRELEALFLALQDQASDHHRFVVFSRPGTLSRDLRPGADGVTVCLQPFEPPQIADWIDRWNVLSREAPGAPALDVEALAGRDLLELAATPILLFLIACTWGAEPPAGGTVDRSGRAFVYEGFFRRIAQGKHELDQQRHPAIAAAGERLLAALHDRGELAAEADPVEAMLWLMARAAWEGARLRAMGRVLTTREVDHLVEDELGIDDGAGVTRAIRIGLLLALQADLGGDLERILFGHRSFEEFLVARHWAGRLRRLIEARERDWPALERELHGAPLVAGALEFLGSMIDGWSEPERELLRRWAEDAVADERLEIGPDDGMRADRRGWLRVVALAIGSRCGPLRLGDPSALRSLLAWVWAIDVPVRLEAPGLVCPGAELQRAALREARLAGADLAGAHLHLSDLEGADLSGARLMGADLFAAELAHACLVDADLSGASLYKVRGWAADLGRACLREAEATEVDLRRAGLSGADLTEAVLEGARLIEVEAEGACFRGASLVGARLDRADLRGAVFADADLTRAVLDGADLTGADLSGAILTDASMVGACLEGANLDGAGATWDAEE